MTDDQILSRMMTLCSRREYCKSDIAAKIAALSPEADAEALIRRLCDEKFIDESRYAAAYVRDKSNLSGWGEAKIRYALQKKGIDKQTIAESMGQIDTERQKERLEKMMRAKAQTLKAASPEERRAKLLRFAVSRGYPYPLADEICRKL